MKVKAIVFRPKSHAPLRERRSMSARTEHLFRADPTPVSPTVSCAREVQARPFMVSYRLQATPINSPEGFAASRQVATLPGAQTPMIEEE